MSQLRPTDRPQGAAGHLTPERKQEIRHAYFASGCTLTRIQLASRFNVNRDTVAACLKGPEYEALRRQYETEIHSEARDVLKSAIMPAAEGWKKAVTVAGEKGDHKPAKDLLMHTGVIEPLDDDGRGTGPLVLMLVNMHDGRQVYRETSSGRTFDIDAETGDVIDLPKTNAPVCYIGTPLAGVQVGAGLTPGPVLTPAGIPSLSGPTDDSSRR